MLKTMIVLAALSVPHQGPAETEKTVAQAPAVTQQIVQKKAHGQGWCDLPRRKPLKGQIVIEWHYDANGVCRLQTASSRDR